MTLINENEYGAVSLVTVTGEVGALDITHKACKAQVSLYGGQVLSWQPTGHEDVFWLSKDSAFGNGTAIRGGIPLCWPWFGGYQNGGNHGFARTQTWLLDKVNIIATGIEITLSWQGKDIHDLWPNEARLTQKLFFGDVFKQELIMENLSNQEAQYTGALHSYFTVSNPSKVKIECLNDVLFDCKLSGDKKISDQKANMVGPMDRIYYSSNDMDIVDEGLQRKITVSSTNCDQWVLWNPGADTASKMKDLHLHSENEFVCLEPANTDWQCFPAGRQVSMAQKISVSHL
ncbi:D-hexose-6-phosphate mutarotase [Thalassotalea atypica]|uniref:D-hexose-6-phosphate mutarotase n=1 Tax=Thalassotalea atypica TaxID=2054316 RepID=UPI0025739C05|nr:D-hexose-6-phosphate mutarotase [Thalassotalea atypica]